jgi:hypothetical protein
MVLWVDEWRVHPPLPAWGPTPRVAGSSSMAWLTGSAGYLKLSRCAALWTNEIADSNAMGSH